MRQKNCRNYNDWKLSKITVSNMCSKSDLGISENMIWGGISNSSWYISLILLAISESADNQRQPSQRK